MLAGAEGPLDPEAGGRLEALQEKLRRLQEESAAAVDASPTLAVAQAADDMTEPGGPHGKEGSDDDDEGRLADIQSGSDASESEEEINAERASAASREAENDRVQSNAEAGED